MIKPLATPLSHINPLYSGNPLTGTFINSKDPDEMPHDAAVHQGLHCKGGKNDLQRKF